MSICQLPTGLCYVCVLVPTPRNLTLVCPEWTPPAVRACWTAGQSPWNRSQAHNPLTPTPHTERHEASTRRREAPATSWYWLLRYTHTVRTGRLVTNTAGLQCPKWDFGSESNCKHQHCPLELTLKRKAMAWVKDVLWLVLFIPVLPKQEIV